MSHLLTALLAWPVLGAAAVALLARKRVAIAKATGCWFAGAQFVGSLGLLARFDPGDPGYQFERDVAWVEPLGIHYHVGIDGFSVWMVLLTALLGWLCLFGGGRSADPQGAGFTIVILLLETAGVGAFIAVDAVLFVVFWELTLVLMYLLMGRGGGRPRVAAATKFWMLTMLGSALMLAAIVYLSVQYEQATGGEWTFDLTRLQDVVLTPQQQFWGFWALVAGFAAALPLVPVHTWLAQVHATAITPVSVVLAGALLQLGGYGMLRFAFPLFPFAAGEGASTLSTLAVVGILAGGLVASAQTDVKRWVAYAAVSHAGLVALGIAGWSTQGLTGAVFHSLGQGISMAALFLLVGRLADRRRTRRVSEYGGLAAVVPRFAAGLGVATLGCAGGPGLVGFVGEMLIFGGTFGPGGSTLVNPEWVALVAVAGMVLSGVYLVRLFHRLMFGPIGHPENRRLADLSLREAVALAPLLGLIVGMGVAPQPFLARIEPSVRVAVARFQLKRCASIRHASGRRAAMLETFLEACPNPEQVIGRTYGGVATGGVVTAKGSR